MSANGNKYEASASAAGYLYQCRYALYTALQALHDRPSLNISIEHFDDVAFDEAGDPVELLQAKHHIAKTGKLNDASNDLWKTLRIWAEHMAADIDVPFKTSFALITTSIAPHGSAASYLKIENRDETKALELLTTVSESSSSVTNNAAYKAFLTLSTTARHSLLRAVKVLDGSPNLADIHQNIVRELAYAVPKCHLPLFVERLEGWWFSIIISSLMKIRSASIPLTALENKMDELREEFARNALPIDYADQYPSDAIVADLDKRPFVRQLRRITIGTRRIELAIRDYYRAYEQRSKWLREDLLVSDEIENFERNLIEAWEPRFEAAKDELENGCSEQHKVNAGQQVFKWAENEADFPFRTIHRRFLTTGSYHILANRHIIGWHPEHSDDVS